MFKMERKKIEKQTWHFHLSRFDLKHVLLYNVNDEWKWKKKEIVLHLLYNVMTITHDLTDGGTIGLLTDCHYDKLFSDKTDNNKNVAVLFTIPEGNTSFHFKHIPIQETQTKQSSSHDDHK